MGNGWKSMVCQPKMAKQSILRQVSHIYPSWTLLVPIWVHRRPGLQYWFLDLPEARLPWISRTVMTVCNPWAMLEHPEIISPTTLDTSWLRFSAYQIVFWNKQLSFHPQPKSETRLRPKWLALRRFPLAGVQDNKLKIETYLWPPAQLWFPSEAV